MTTKTKHQSALKPNGADTIGAPFGFTSTDDMAGVGPMSETRLSPR